MIEGVGQLGGMAALYEYGFSPGSEGCPTRLPESSGNELFHVPNVSVCPGGWMERGGEGMANERFAD